MRNLHKFIENNYGLEALHLLWGWEKWEIKDSEYRNHWRFTLRCISKDLIQVSARQKSTRNSRNRRAKEIIHWAEKQLLQDSIKCTNGILCEDAIKLDRCRSRWLVTTITRKECTSFINKVREPRFIKIRDRWFNKFIRWVGYKERDREIITQSIVSNGQMQPPNNTNKWVINLSSTPLTQAQESLLSKDPRPNYVMASKPPI